MREFPRLPPPLRVVRLLGLLGLLASFLLFAHLFDTFLAALSSDSWRVLMIAVNLLILSGTCFTVVRSYRVRSAPSDRGPFPLNAWQSQVRAIGLWTALPLCALALAVVIPPTADAFGMVFPATMLAGVELIVTRFLAGESSGSMRTPGA
ncbi:MAG TPA: hypothetical protein VGS80_05680 [Ktedonobacterales bacterium]|nr:hypothetical protein [Ktedonobacterales bacterium]